MSDRELLELAAKAAGLYRAEPALGGGIVYAGGKYWTPLTDDGDALRLARTLGICIHFTTCADDAPIVGCGYDCTQAEWVFYPNFPDSGAATRRAIVRAAAAIGEQMP